MGLVTEFKAFVGRGNVLDLAVGVIIGASFGKIVTSLVEQVVMPPIGLLLGRADFANLKWILASENPATATVEEVAIGYGAFINTLIQFAVVAVVVFLLVRMINRLRRDEVEPEAAAGPTPTEALLVEIRDELKARTRV